MAVSYSEQVQQAYLAYYGRPADPAGQAYWTQQLTNANGNLSAIINAFGTSAESTALYAGTSLVQQVNAIYNQLFGHNADTAGLAFYVNGLEQGTYTLASIALNVYNGATGTDVGVLAAKQAYADAFTLQVAQTTAAQVAYSGTTAANNARADVAAVWNTSNEATSAATLATTVANIGSVGGTGTVTTPPVTSFSLTTGVDSIAPTGNSVINATIGSNLTPATTGTLSVGDSIVATGTNNTLNIVDLSGGSTFPGATTVSGVQTVNLTSGAATGTANFTGFTGLTQLNVTETGGAAGITAASTTNVNLTDTAAAPTSTTLTAGTAGAIYGAYTTLAGDIVTSSVDNINVQGGANVSVTANGVTSQTVVTTGAVVDAVVANTINVGTTTAVTGTVTVVANQSATATGANSGDIINVKGGTVDTITANLSEKAGLGNTVTGGTITVNGTSATTTVTVNQTASVAAANAVQATAGSAGATVLPAAPGVTGVATATAAATVAASAAVAGVADGAVNIQDAAYNTASANTITAIALNNYGAGSTIKDNALASLQLSGTAGTLFITDATAGNLVPTANSTLSLVLNGLKVGVDNTGTALFGGNTITDVNGEVKTLNVTTSTANSTLTAFNDANLTTLNVSGTNVLTLGSINGTLTALNVSGAAGFSDSATAFNGGLAGDAVLTTITDTSSGKFSAALNAVTQSFTGSTGQDVITINDQTQAGAFKGIAAGSATNNELILDGGAYNLTAAQAAKVTGFQTIGLTNAVTGAINLAVLDATASTVDFIGNVANTAALQSITLSGAAKGAAISIDASYTSGTAAVANSVGAGSVAVVGTDAINVNYADFSGSTDSTTITLGAATNSKAIIVDALNLADANGNGIGTLTFVSNDSGYVPAAGGVIGTPNTGNIIGTLGDNGGSSGLNTLNVSGTGALTINSLIDNSTTFTLNNTDAAAGGVTIGAFTETGLGNLSFTGSGNSTISVMSDGNATGLSISNTGTGLASIGTLGANLSSLTLSGNIALGQAATANAALGLQDLATSGVAVSGATDNAHVTVNLTAGAAASATDTITLGNGNNYVIDASSAGKVNIAVGTGSNLIDVSSSVLNGVTAVSTNEASTYAASVTLGAHSAATGVDSIVVGGVAANTATAAQTVINGAGASDIISFRGDSVTAAGATTFGLTTATQATAAQQAALTTAASTSLATAVTLADTYLGAGHAAIGFQFGGNTYVVEHTAATTAFAAGDAVIELTGLHTVGSVNAAHGLVLAS
jgi:S-layer protein